VAGAHPPSGFPGGGAPLPSNCAFVRIAARRLGEASARARTAPFIRSKVYFGALSALRCALRARCGPTNSAMFAEIVPETLRSTVYAFDRSFEGAVGACAAPLVGLIAERAFGFSGAVAAPDGGDGGAAGRRNAAALGSSLLLCLVVPWALCLLCYTGAGMLGGVDGASVVDELTSVWERRRASVDSRSGRVCPIWHAEQGVWSLFGSCM
jgi:hypothetical protein